jgi:hypothetical protein
MDFVLSTNSSREINFKKTAAEKLQ